MKSFWFLAAALLVPAISPLAAQTFDLQILSNGNAFDAANGSTIPFQAQSIGSDNQIFVAAVYLGSQSATILHTDLLGPSDFSVQGAGTPTLRTGDSYSFSVHYRASSSAFEQALLTVTYQEATIPTPQVSTFRLTLTGAAPQIAVSYELATDKSFRPVTTGSEIDLPATPPGTPVLATITVANVGSGPGVIRSASINGSSFDLVGLPFLPATLAAGQNLTFSVRSSPSSPGAYTATLEIDGPNGPFTCSVTETSVSVTPTYALVGGASAGPVSAGATIAFADALVGGQSSLRLRVSNQTGQPFSVAALSLTGSSDFQFTVATQPPFTLASGDTFDVVLTFSPSHAQASTSILKVGSDSWLLTGNGLAAPLGFTYSSAAGLTAIAAGGTLAVPAAAIGATQTVQFQITNLTSQGITVNAVGIAESNSPFRIASSGFPLTLAPQQVVQVLVALAPQATGILNGTLVVDSYLFKLQGVGLPPSNLPGVSLTGPQGQIAALQQDAIGVSLQAPYAVDVTGTLSLSFDGGALAADPAMQFSTGGTTIAFKIPAGTQTATFSNGAAKVGLQTGSVAGNIRLATTVQTSSNFDLTGSAPAELDLQISPTAPIILGASVVNTGGSYSLQILGMATGRTLKSLTLNFVSTGTMALNPSTVTLDLSTTASSWFRSSSSLQFGGLFSLSLPLSINAPSAAGTTLTLPDLVKSIGVVAANDLGSSSAYTVPVN